ncbi:hypothetical protein FOXB_01092, partial [Fusarium oxysporum f. sp. conglutinans Fo5176]
LFTLTLKQSSMPSSIDLKLIGNVINASSLSNSMSTSWLDLELIPGQLMHTQPRLNADGMALMEQKVVAGNLVAPQLVQMNPRPAPLFLRAEPQGGSQEKRFKLRSKSNAGTWCRCYHLG